MTKIIIATLITFATSWILMKLLLPILIKAKAGQNILHYVKEHTAKQGTPTMGGISFVVAISVMSLIFLGVDNVVVLVTIAVVVAYCIVGFLDDYIKIRLHDNQGLKPYQKIIGQLSIAIIVALFATYQVGIGSLLYVPLFNIYVDIGWWMIPLVVLIFLAVTNGVNLTDGMDGLATSTTIMYLVGLVALLFDQLDYLDSVGDTIGYDNVYDLIVVSCISIGALLAFVLFNCYPAKVFMGDSGSLALGALVTCVSMFSRVSLVIPILGVMFVVSCASVIIQVAYYKLTKGKRVFLMAPYHHHLQHKGYSETRIATIYTIITLIMVCIVLLGSIR